MSTQPSGFVVLHFGPMPISSMQKATKVAGKDAVIDTDAARLSGASFAFGNPELMELLKARLLPGAHAAAQNAHPSLPPEAVLWLAQGERGMSSEAIFSNLTGTTIGDRDDADAHPHDPADLRRCRLLLEAVPSLQAKLPSMAAVSPVWGRLVDAWDELCALMDQESPAWRDKGGSCAKTYARMRAIIQQGTTSA